LDGDRTGRHREELDRICSRRRSLLEEDERCPDVFRIDVELLAEEMLVEEELEVFPPILPGLPVPPPGACLKVADVQNVVTVLRLLPDDDIDEPLEFHVDVIVSRDPLEELILVVDHRRIPQLLALIETTDDPLPRGDEIFHVLLGDSVLVLLAVLGEETSEFLNEEDDGLVDRQRILFREIPFDGLVDRRPEIKVDREDI
jgi:hypothetical protein